MDRPDPLRQHKWDCRFLKMAELVASWSKDPSTQTGAVIVRPDRSVVSLGYNGFPRGMEDDPEDYKDREYKYRRIIHCEMNAVLQAGQSVQGCTLYTVPFLSCERCAVHMVQAGIVRVVGPSLPEHLKERWEEPLNVTKQWFREAGVEITEISNYE